MAVAYAFNALELLRQADTACLPVTIAFVLDEVLVALLLGVMLSVLDLHQQP